MPPLKGQPRPRIAPPTPARSDIKAFREVAEGIGISLMPWQAQAARYIEAQAPGGRHLYREVGIVVARQNGKTTLLVPLIVKRLRAGQRIMHTAQNRDLPREVFGQVADVMSNDMTLFPTRNGRPTKPRFANGQEEIRLANGGMYSIVAPTRGGARGPSRDLVIVDELREMDTWDFIAAAKPTMTASKDPQMLYLSNAGEDDSIVLNALRDRAGKDPSLAYLEWSAAPERRPDDPRGWAESNPAMGHEVGEMGSVYETLTADHRTAVLERTMALFEVEHLCRWVNTTRQSLVPLVQWEACEGDVEAPPARTYLGIAYDPAGRRASAALAWPMSDDRVGLRLLFDVPGDPIDTALLGKDMRAKARELGVVKVGFDWLTDAMLAKYFRRTEPVTASKFANASARFVTLVEAGKLRWEDAHAVGSDLEWTARKDHDESGSFQAVRADDERPITAALAAIRAVALASEPARETVTSVPQVSGF